MVTFAPASASRRAVAAPSPEAPPATSAVAPWICMAPEPTRCSAGRGPRRRWRPSAASAARSRPPATIGGPSPLTTGESVRNSSSSSPASSSARLTVGPPSHSSRSTPRAAQVGEHRGESPSAAPPRPRRRRPAPRPPRACRRARAGRAPRTAPPPTAARTSARRAPPGTAAARSPRRHGARADDQRVGAPPQRQQHLQVLRAAELARGAVQRRAPVERGDHDRAHPRPALRRARGLADQIVGRHRRAVRPDALEAHRRGEATTNG